LRERRGGESAAAHPASLTAFLIRVESLARRANYRHAKPAKEIK
jgi:hypothetical protein